MGSQEFLLFPPPEEKTHFTFFPLSFSNRKEREGTVRSICVPCTFSKRTGPLYNSIVEKKEHKISSEMILLNWRKKKRIYKRESRWRAVVKLNWSQLLQDFPTIQCLG